MLGFSHLNVSGLLDHLESKALALTTLEKNQKLADIQCKWDKNDDIGTYFNKIKSWRKSYMTTMTSSGLKRCSCYKW